MENKCILVTEDNPAEFKLLKKALNDCCPDICVEWAKDGFELIRHLETHDHPDIVLLDLNMPRMNGFEALDAIRSRNEFSHVPIVILTTSEDQEQILAAYQKGSNSFVRKPFTYSELKEFVAAFKEYWFELVSLPPPKALRKSA